MEKLMTKNMISKKSDNKIGKFYYKDVECTRQTGPLFGATFWPKCTNLVVKIDPQ